MTHERIINGMANEDYHSTPAVSNTILSSMDRSPAHCYAMHIAPDRKPPAKSAAFFAGTLAHCAILEPGSVLDRYIVKPAGLDMRTKEGRAWKDDLPAGVELLDSEQYLTALYQRDAVMAVPELAELFASGVAEVSAFWRDEETGLDCKCRPDWVHTLSDGRVVLVDVKTTPDSNPQQFTRTVWRYGYHRQAAWYSAGYAIASGVEVAGFVFASVTNAYPFIGAAHALDDDYLRIGRDEYRSLLDEFADCKLTGRWPAFPGMNLLSPPAWAAQSDEMEGFHV